MLVSEWAWLRSRVKPETAPGFIIEVRAQTDCIEKFWAVLDIVLIVLIVEMSLTFILHVKQTCEKIYTCLTPL